MNRTPANVHVRRILGPALAVVLSLLALLRPDTLSLIGLPDDLTPGTEMLLPMLWAACFLSLAWFGARVILIGLTWSGDGKRRPSKLLQDTIAASSFLAAIVASALLAFDLPVTGVVASSSVLIAVLGFALRNVIADVVAGMALGLEQSYRIGDWLAIDGGISGRVIEVNWRTTRLLTRDQIHVLLPNARLAQQRLTNYSAPRRHFRDQVRIILDFSVPVGKAKGTLLRAIHQAELILRDPPPDVRVVAYEPTGIAYVIRFWVPGYGQEIDCRDAVLSSIDAALRDRGLPVPRSRLITTISREECVQLPAADQLREQASS